MRPKYQVVFENLLERGWKVIINKNERPPLSMANCCDPDTYRVVLLNRDGVSRSKVSTVNWKAGLVSLYEGIIWEDIKYAD